MKKLFLLPLLFIATNILAAELTTFDQVKSAAVAGQSIRFVIDFKHCDVNNKASSTSHLAMFTTDTMHIFDDKIVSSFNHFTLNSPGAIDTPVMEYLHYTFTADNKLILTHQKLDARNYAPLSKPETISCSREAGGFKVYS